MPLFFFLSGLFTGFIYRDLRAVIKSRVRRIVIPYFIWSFFLASSMQVASRYTTNGLGLKQFLISPFVPFSEYWFLYALFFIELLYLLIHQLFPQKTLFVAFYLSVALFLLKPILPHVWIFPLLNEYLLFFAAATLLSGVLLKESTRELLKKPTIIGATAVLFIGAMFVLLRLLMLTSPVLSDYFLVVTSILGGGLVIELSMLFEAVLYQKGLSVFTNLGRNTMKIYVMHLIPLAGLRIIFLRLIGVNQLWIVVVTTFLVAMFLCWLADIVISRLHLSRLLFGQL